jgi:hypothetical protein
MVHGRIMVWETIERKVLAVAGRYISEAEQRVSPGSGVQKFFVKLPKTGSWIDS